MKVLIAALASSIAATSSSALFLRRDEQTRILLSETSEAIEGDTMCAKQVESLKKSIDEMSKVLETGEFFFVNDKFMNTIFGDSMCPALCNDGGVSVSSVFEATKHAVEGVARGGDGNSRHLQVLNSFAALITPIWVVKLSQSIGASEELQELTQLATGEMEYIKSALLALANALLPGIKASLESAQEIVTASVEENTDFASVVSDLLEKINSGDLLDIIKGSAMSIKTASADLSSYSEAFFPISPECLGEMAEGANEEYNLVMEDVETKFCAKYC